MSLVASNELDNAVDRGDVQAVERALRGGVSPNAVWSDGDAGDWPLLCSAAQVLSSPVCCVAIRSLFVSFYFFVLVCACNGHQGGHREVVALLIERGADVDQVNSSSGATPLYIAAEVSVSSVCWCCVRRMLLVICSLLLTIATPVVVFWCFRCLCVCLMCIFG